MKTSASSLCSKTWQNNYREISINCSVALQNILSISLVISFIDAALWRSLPPNIQDTREFLILFDFDWTTITLTSALYFFSSTLIFNFFVYFLFLTGCHKVASGTVVLSMWGC